MRTHIEDLLPPAFFRRRDHSLTFLELLRVLEHAASDPRVAGVLIRLDGMRRGFSRVLTLRRAVEQVCAVLLATMTVVILLGVAFRYVLEAPLPWSEELAKLLMLWIVFLGASAGIHRGEHVTIDFLLQRPGQYLRSVGCFFQQQPDSLK